MAEPEGCWDAWFEGLGDALRSRTEPRTGKPLESEPPLHPEQTGPCLSVLPFPVSAGGWDDE